MTTDSAPAATMESAHDRRKWKFHVSLRKLKRKGLKAQFKFGRHVLAEGPGARVEEFYALAEQWNKEGRKMTTKAEFADAAKAFLDAMPTHQDELNFGGPTLPFATDKKEKE